MTASKTRKAPRVNIAVTQEMIDASTKRDSSHCMIAEALQQAVPEAKFISVDLATIRFTDLRAGTRYIYLTPRRAQEALLAFDQGERVEPFTVQIAGAHVLATGSARKARATLKPGETGDSVPVRSGGKAPPVGPLNGGAGQSRPSVVGRRREYGLRALVR